MLMDSGEQCVMITFIKSTSCGMSADGVLHKIGKYSLPFFPTLGSYDTQYTNTTHSYLVKFLVQYMYVRLLYCE